MNKIIKILILFILSITFIALYLFYDLGTVWEYALPRRFMKVSAIVVTGAVIAVSTVIFQTITNNRILTPSMIGLDSLYMLIQTFLIFFFGSTNLTVMDKQFNFILSVALMILFAGLLYKFLFKREGQNIYVLLLAGIICGTFFSSLTDFMQVIIDPNEFMIVQDRMFASFNNVNTDLLMISIVIIILTSIYLARFFKYLDVLSLGKEHAINLGVDFDYVVKRLLMVIAIFISISTALVGPITFLGLIVSNVAYQFLNTYRHSYLLIGSVLISVIFLVSGQFIVEKIFTFSTTLSVIINFIGGVYFIYLLLKESKSW